MSVSIQLKVNRLTLNGLLNISADNNSSISPFCLKFKICELSV